MAFPTHADYLISGAGIHGLSTAWRLAERLSSKGETVEGRIIVLDKSGIASGASGIACGVVRNNYFQPAMRRLMAHSVDVWESDPKGLSYHPVGYMQISCESMREDVASIYEQQKAIGYESVFIEGASASDAYMKDMFNDFEFRDSVRLAGVNSINWARVLAQAVYYFSSALALGAPQRQVSFTVPTGNFGDIFAGYIAKKMGLPIDKLVVATNQNDILHRCLTQGEYKTSGVIPSISPSMDIQVSSNFERLLFEAYARDGAAVSTLMAALKAEGGFSLSQGVLETLQRDFQSGRCGEEQTRSQIGQTLKGSGELLCPHSAIGVHVAEQQIQPETPMITLATAHPAKFPDAVEAATGLRPDLPPHLADLFERRERIARVANDLDALKQFIKERIAL